MLMEAARFAWWMAAAALAVAFLGALRYGLSRRRWIERATVPRLLLGVLEVGALAAWFAVRGRWRFLPEADDAVAMAGALLALTGALFAAWARFRLGSLFSPQLGVQEGHRLITTGPYAVVRHPIYLGLIDFILGSALFLNDVGLFLVGILFIFFFLGQIHVEERLFSRHFGDEWAVYRDRTPALFPRVLRHPR